MKAAKKKREEYEKNNGKKYHHNGQRTQAVCLPLLSLFFRAAFGKWRRNNNKKKEKQKENKTKSENHKIKKQLELKMATDELNKTRGKPGKIRMQDTPGTHSGALRNPFDFRRSSLCTRPMPILMVQIRGQREKLRNAFLINYPGREHMKGRKWRG